jgi:parallel beta-helix repeat protein
LERFSVVNTSDEFWNYAGIRVLSKNNLFQNNTISYHQVGFWVENSDENRFCGNYFGWNTVGIFLNNSCGNGISNNSFMDNFIGIDGEFNSHYNIVSYNNFNGNGIQFVESSYNEITMNNITNNTNILLKRQFGIALARSHQNVIKENSINNYETIGIHLWTASENLIIRNNLIHNGFFGVYLYKLSRDNMITQNNFIDNGFRKDVPDRVNYLDNAFFFNCFFNKWNANYWDDWNFRLPRIIKGRLGIIGFIPFFNIDWNPSKEPYDIDV